MNTEKIIRDLLLAGVSPKEIAATADQISADLTKETKARKQFMSAAVAYLKDLGLEPSDKEIKNLEIHLKEFEQELKGPYSFKLDDYNRWFNELIKALS